MDSQKIKELLDKKIEIINYSDGVIKKSTEQVQEITMSIFGTTREDEDSRFNFLRSYLDNSRFRSLSTLQEIKKLLDEMSDLKLKWEFLRRDFTENDKKKLLWMDEAEQMLKESFEVQDKVIESEIYKETMSELVDEIGQYNMWYDKKDYKKAIIHWMNVNRIAKKIPSIDIQREFMGIIKERARGIPTNLKIIRDNGGDKVGQDG